jgi:hypothetical protein
VLVRGAPESGSGSFLKQARSCRRPWKGRGVSFSAPSLVEAFQMIWAGNQWSIIGYMSRVGQNHIGIYGVYTVFLAGKSPNIRSYMVHVYGPGQPYEGIRE